MGRGTGGSVSSVDQSLAKDDTETLSGGPVTSSGTLARTAVDAGSDKLVGWDDSADKKIYFTLGTNLTTSGSTLNAAGGSGHIIQEEGSSLTARSKLNLLGTAVTAVDNSGADSTDVTITGPIGKHTAWIPACTMTPSATGGCASLATIVTAANKPDIQSLNFDPTTAEYCQFDARMPKGWDLGTITYSIAFSHPATTTNFGVTWQLEAVAISSGDTQNVAFGTAVLKSKTGGTTDTLYFTDESTAVTIAGSPAAQDYVKFRIGRVPSDGSDTLAVDARLEGITIYYTTNAPTDD